MVLKLRSNHDKIFEMENKMDTELVDTIYYDGGGFCAILYRLIRSDRIIHLFDIGNEILIESQSVIRMVSVVVKPAIIAL